ncbi:zinc-dependent alcohol dehydrogenase [Desulfolutivibrio sp.]|uniref:zinc-dependent alcohol dehydrogenase n=1 Tax=Desulfolutivibrio sp. TaxID=2773296 RepID=UPI002F962B32
MKALLYEKSIPRYLASALAARLDRRRFFPRVSPLRLAETPYDPPAGWVRLRTLLCGICGSDLGLLKGHESVLLEPYASMPSVLGHEILAVVEQAPDGSGFSPGQRVAVEPILPCETRGLAPCRFCAAGDYNLCENFMRGDLPPGAFLGFNAKAPGGMAERTAAHPSRLFPVPDHVPDETAILLDSLASVLHPVLVHFPRDADTVVVNGMGILGQHAVRSLRALGSKARIVAVARHGFQAVAAQAGGADVVLRSPGRKALGEAVGATFVPTTLGGGNLEGGADLFLDCAGGARAFQEGLLALRAGGTYVMVGTTARLSGADVSSLWFRQLAAVGSASYGHATDPRTGKRARTYEVALELLASGEYPTQGLLTHTFRLDDYAKAFTAAFDKRGHSSMKVAFDLRP